MTAFNNLAMGIIGIFVPIYLLDLGYSFTYVMIFLAVHHSTLLAATFMSVFISNKIGLVKVLQIRFLFLFAYIFALYSLPEMPALLFWIAILGGIEAAFYWEPLNIFFIRNTEENKMGAALSALSVVGKIVGIITPLIGAFVAVQYGFSALFIVAAMLFVIPIIPILPLSSEKTNFIFTWARAKEIYIQNKHYLIPEIIDNLAEDAMVLWMIFIYMKLVSVLEIGILGTVISLTGILFVVTIGKLSDEWDTLKLLRIGAFLVTVSWIFGFFVAEYAVNNILFYVVTIVMAFVMKVFLVPYGSFLYNRARKDDAQFVVLREIPTIGGRLILFALAILLQDNLPILFLLIGILFIYFQFFKPNGDGEELKRA